MSLISWLWRGLYGIGGLAGLGIGLLYFMQEKLLYVPVLPGMAKEYDYNPSQFEMSYEDVYLDTKDGLHLHSWLLWDPSWTRESLKQKPVVIFFQVFNLSFACNVTVLWVQCVF